MKVIFFPNGNTACFDKAGHQIPRFQKAYLRLYCEFLKRQGINPEEVEFTMPNSSKAKVFAIEGGWNWKIR